jgi:predicted dehydrogenase
MAQRSSDGKVKVGVVGSGFGRNHILAFQATEGVEVAAFCQRTKAVAEKTAGEFKIPQVFTDYGEMLERGGLDAVSLATPTNVHLPLTMEALDRGVAVLCEKPLAMNQNEAEAMLKKAEERRVIHVTAFNFRFIPAFFRMKELLEEDYVGNKILHVEANWFTEGRGDPKAPFRWRYQKETAGFGAMGDVGVHLVDLVRWLAGDFKKICGQQAIFTKERTTADGRKAEVTVEDCAIFIGELKAGGLVSFQANAAARGGVYQSVTVLGNEGVLKAEVDRNKPKWIIGSLAGAQGSGALQPLLIPERLSRGVDASDPRRAMGESIFANLTRLMAEGIRSGKQPSPSFRDGLEAQKVLDALVTSSESGSWVSVG